MPHDGYAASTFVFPWGRWSRDRGSTNLSAGFVNCNQCKLQFQSEGAGLVMMVRCIFFAGVVVLALSACESTRTPTSSSGLTREQFIELFVALRNAQNTARSTAELETMRRAIFTRAGVTPEQ